MRVFLYAVRRARRRERGDVFRPARGARPDDDVPRRELRRCAGVLRRAASVRAVPGGAVRGGGGGAEASAGGDRRVARGRGAPRRAARRGARAEKNKRSERPFRASQVSSREGSRSRDGAKLVGDWDARGSGDDRGDRRRRAATGGDGEERYRETRNTGKRGKSSARGRSVADDRLPKKSRPGLPRRQRQGGRRDADAAELFAGAADPGGRQETRLEFNREAYDGAAVAASAAESPERSGGYAARGSRAATYGYPVSNVDVRDVRGGEWRRARRRRETPPRTGASSRQL
mmetsp:Transcript_13911/g.59512  ORF Transcript_13911/g.59512 Transcript_13911/m.59512 type:complete len:289 (-) Transcript_13911:853-1719(-)